jgi:hypothetical protein
VKPNIKKLACGVVVWRAAGNNERKIQFKQTAVSSLAFTLFREVKLW